MAALSQRVAVAMLMLSGLRIAAQVPADVPNAARIRAYVAAFNGGEDQMADFLKSNVADSALQQRSVADRLAVYRRLQQRMKSIEVLGIPNVQISGQNFAVTAHVRSGSGEEADLTFNFDPQPPNKLISLRVEDAVGAGPQSGFQPIPEPIAQADFIKKVAALLDDTAQKDEFSGVVLLARDGKPIFQKAYGFANKEKRIANNLDTKFNLGSINKTFTRICIEQLAQKGKLSLDDTLGKFLPDYPNHEAAEKVTIAQLLNMTSGIGDFFGERFVAADKTKVRTLADYLSFFADKPLLFPPGTSNRYSNGGYIVLGLIIEKISGQSYYDFVKQNVFQPAGMKDSDWYALDQQVPNRAEGYTRQGGDARRSNREMQPAVGSSAGGGYSTAPDLLRFANALAAHKLQNSNAGLGIGGGSPGVNAALESDAHGNTIIVLSNYDPPTAEATARQIRLWMAGLKPDGTR